MANALTFHGFTFQGLPAFNQSPPKRPVFGVAGRSGKAAALIGTPAEFVVWSGLSNFHGKVFVVRGAISLGTKSEQKSRKKPAGGVWFATLRRFLGHISFEAAFRSRAGRDKVRLGD